jgi:hypothetical protein
MATPTNLPAAFVSGAILTADQMNNLRGAFRVLQVVTGATNTTVANNTSTFADTGLTATITPQSATSKILVLVNQSFSKTAGNANNAVVATIQRGATNIFTFQGAALYTGTTLDMVGSASSAIVLDSPATTSATTYKTQFANFTNAAGVGANPNTAGATIILMEISA